MSTTVVPETPPTSPAATIASQPTEKPARSRKDILQEQLETLDTALPYFSDSPPLSPVDQSIWLTGKKPTTAQVSAVYAPIGLKTPFEKLYSILRPSLIPGETQTNGAAFLQGRRGSGKTLVLERCLQALRDELSTRTNQRPFRVISLNGILVPGKHIAIVLNEILLQVSAVAFHETEESPSKKQKQNRASEKLHELLRLKKSTFTNSVQLLNETLQIASADGIPFLFVLDELDAFLEASGRSWTTDSRGSVEGPQERQVLLYHLLDRVATTGSFVSFVGLTCDQGTVRRLEKRIRSRAEGTSQFIDFGPCQTFDIMKKALLSKIPSGDLQEQMRKLMETSREDSKEKEIVLETLQHDYRLGKDMRWFCRVIGYALALHRQDVAQMVLDNQPNECTFNASHLLEAMTDMGASFITKDRDVVQLDGVVDPILRALCDLSGPQIALLLAARRILTREGHRDDRAGTIPLTAERLWQEQSSYRGMSSRYNRFQLEQALEDLCSLGLIRPAADHTGGAPFQYQLENVHDKTDLERVALHLTVDVARQLGKALEDDLLQCSTALREWGRKTN